MSGSRLDRSMTAERRVRCDSAIIRFQAWAAHDSRSSRPRRAAGSRCRCCRRRQRSPHRSPLATSSSAPGRAACSSSRPSSSSRRHLAPARRGAGVQSQLLSSAGDDRARSSAVGYLVWGLFVLMKRQLLWRVRRKLILSYIFIGVVPALLIVVSPARRRRPVDERQRLPVQGRLRRRSSRTRTARGRGRGGDRAHPGESAAKRSSGCITNNGSLNYPGLSLLFIPVGRRCVTQS